MIRFARFALAAAAALAAAGVFLFLPRLTVLSVAEAKTGRILLVRALDGSGRFALSYTHSFNKGRIVETYRLGDDGTVLLQGATFENFGAGVPEDVHFSGGGLNLTESRSMPEIPLFIGTVAGHVLSADGWDIALRELAPPMTNIRIGLKRMSTIEFLWRQVHG